MVTHDLEMDQQARVPDGSEYSAALRHAHASRERGRISNHTLRFVYFSLAAIWGFIAGVAALLVGLSVFEKRVTPTAPILLALVPAAIGAVIGARVLAGAYEEVRRRRR